MNRIFTYFESRENADRFIKWVGVFAVIDGLVTSTILLVGLLNR